MNSNNSDNLRNRNKEKISTPNKIEQINPELSIIQKKFEFFTLLKCFKINCVIFTQKL